MDNVVFTNEVAGELCQYLKDIDRKNVFVLTDDNTVKYCLGCLDACHFVPQNIITIGSGEHNKTIESVIEIWNRLVSLGARRNSILINVGGGLVSDVGGFAASCFKRGMKFVNIPTTLLSQVDASVGGKTGINFSGLKNEIGVFSLPDLVIIDNCFYKTLPKRQLMSGFAEMLKHALLSGEERLAEIMDLDLERMDSPVFLQYIEESVEVKETIVSDDPKEKGIRKALNLGHTVGHAIESVAIDNNVELYHGEAVAYGLIVALKMSVIKLGFNEKLFMAVQRFITSHYPKYVPLATSEQIYSLMLHDKKNDGHDINFTLLRSIGEFEIDNHCTKDEVLCALNALLTTEE